jgi:hypothetical protein
MRADQRSLQGRSQLRGVGGQSDQVLQDVVPRRGLHADGEVDRGLAQRLGRVQPPTGEVERVSGAQNRVDDRWPFRLGRNGFPMVGPRLVGQGMLMDWFVDGPALFASDLDDEDIVHVVMRIESPGRCGRDVRVERLGRTRERSPFQLPAQQLRARIKRLLSGSPD